jgi:hypothetical protein
MLGSAPYICGDLPFEIVMVGDDHVNQYNVNQHLSKSLYHSFRRVHQQDGARFWHKVGYGLESGIQRTSAWLDRAHDRSKFYKHFAFLQARFRGGMVRRFLKTSGISSWPICRLVLLPALFKGWYRDIWRVIFDR